jgi:hypothetical protein
MGRCLAWIGDPQRKHRYCSGLQTYRGTPQAVYHDVSKCIAHCPLPIAYCPASWSVCPVRKSPTDHATGTGNIRIRHQFILVLNRNPGPRLSTVRSVDRKPTRQPVAAAAIRRSSRQRSTEIPQALHAAPPQRRHAIRPDGAPVPVAMGRQPVESKAPPFPKPRRRRQKLPKSATRAGNSPTKPHEPSHPAPGPATKWPLQTHPAALQSPPFRSPRRWAPHKG